MGTTASPWQQRWRMRSRCALIQHGSLAVWCGLPTQVYPRAHCLVVSTENITQNWYFGNQRSMLIPNCLFRVGGAAMLLSNKATDYWRAK